MRIIAGTARGRRLLTLKGEDTRPTLERVKEGIFSAAQFWLPGASVLDLFAGSGQLGLEALSRGAKHCTFVDSSPEAVSVIKQNADSLGLATQCRILRSTAVAFLARTTDRFDFVVMDPPYRSGELPRLLKMVSGICAPAAMVLCESEADIGLPQATGGLALEKQYRYGTVIVSRYRMAGDPLDDTPRL